MLYRKWNKQNKISNKKKKNATWLFIQLTSNWFSIIKHSCNTVKTQNFPPQPLSLGETSPPAAPHLTSHPIFTTFHLLPSSHPNDSPESNPSLKEGVKSLCGNTYGKRDKYFHHLKTPSQRAVGGCQKLKQGGTSGFAAQNVTARKGRPQWAWGSLIHPCCLPQGPGMWSHILHGLLALTGSHG